MPHIVFDKKIDLEDFSKKFLPILQKETILIKIDTIFVDKQQFTALLPTIVISDLHQEFFIEISTRKMKTTIRLYPGTDPEKTDGVKMSMALLAKQTPIFASNNLLELCAHFTEQELLPPFDENIEPKRQMELPDLQDVRGQHRAEGGPHRTAAHRQ